MKDSTIEVYATIYAVNGRDPRKVFANVAVGEFMYINSICVMPDTFGQNDEIYVGMPYYNARNQKRKAYIEYPKMNNNPLYLTIYEAIKSAYDEYRNTEKISKKPGKYFFLSLDKLAAFKTRTSKPSQNSTEDFDDSDFDKDINLDDIQF